MTWRNPFATQSSSIAAVVIVAASGLELVVDRETREPADALGAAVTAECLRRGLSMNIVRAGTNANCFRMAPPLSIEEAEIDVAVEILDASIAAVLAANAELAPT